MSKQSDEAIEKALTKLSLALELTDKRQDGQYVFVYHAMQIVKEELDPILTPNFPIPAIIVHGHYQGHSHLPMQAIKGWTFQQAVDFINLVACSKDTKNDIKT